MRDRTGRRHIRSNGLQSKARPDQAAPDRGHTLQCTYNNIVPRAFASPGKTAQAPKQDPIHKPTATGSYQRPCHYPCPMLELHFHSLRFSAGHERTARCVLRERSRMKEGPGAMHRYRSLHRCSVHAMSHFSTTCSARRNAAQMYAPRSFTDPHTLNARELRYSPPMEARTT